VTGEALAGCSPVRLTNRQYTDGPN
jgi:hypothetical protein